MFVTHWSIDVLFTLSYLPPPKPGARPGNWLGKSKARMLPTRSREDSTPVWWKSICRWGLCTCCFKVMGPWCNRTVFCAAAIIRSAHWRWWIPHWKNTGHNIFKIVIKLKKTASYQSCLFYNTKSWNITLLFPPFWNMIISAKAAIPLKWH